MIQDPALDRSSSKVFPVTKSARTLSSVADQLGLSDLWRYKYPTTNLFSFFLNVHHTYSRIDFLLLDNRLLPNISSCFYHSLVISDHAPTHLDLTLPTQPEPFRQWRFNSELLTDDRQFLRSQIKLFLELNDLPETKRSMVREASKAYLRGQLISFISNCNKVETSNIANLLKQIKDLESKYAIGGRLVMTAEV